METAHEAPHPRERDEAGVCRDGSLVAPATERAHVGA